MIKTDRIILSVEDVEFILKWRDENKDLVREMAVPLKSVKLVFPDSGFEFTAIATGNKFKFYVNQNGKRFGNVEFERLGEGKCKISKDRIKELGEDEKQTVLTVYASTMAFLLHGGSDDVIKRENDEVEIKSDGSSVIGEKGSTNGRKRKSSSTTYILRRSGNTAQMAVRGSHRSPAMSFGVRGHYRHYKSGKVVWINEYVKGKGEKKDKTYKLGGRKNEKK